MGFVFIYPKKTWK